MSHQQKSMQQIIDKINKERDELTDLHDKRVREASE